tara:strand:+ start:980 stop:1456 length:477 start_codon:yes stop_codon:yes gene_type:complete
MKFIIASALLIAMSIPTYGYVKYDIIELRELYYSSVNSKVNTDKLVEYLKQISFNSTAINKGYKGMSFLLISKHSWNPLDKLSFFKQGVLWLESSIENDSCNIELRFLRLTAQINLPSFLNYNNYIDEDRDYLVSNYKYLDDGDLKIKISNYLLLQTK